MNDQGDYFIIYGICWGMQALHVFENPTEDSLSDGYDSTDYSNNMILLPDAYSSRMFSLAD